jgi:hypothetical protein
MTEQKMELVNTRQGGGAMELREKSRFESLLQYAQMTPRSITRFLERATEMVTANEDVAAGCNYSVPRAGKRIPGPSVRLAEIAASTWGNISVEVEDAGQDGKFVYAKGKVLDLETLTGLSVEVSRRITDKNGRQYSDDMIQTTKAAARSFAYREAVFKVVPKAYINQLHAAAIAVTTGGVKSIAERRDIAMKLLAQFGVTDERVFAMLGIEGIDEMGEDELVALRSEVQRIREREVTPEEAFPELPPEGVMKPGAAGMAERIKAQKAQKGKKKPEAAPEAPSETEAAGDAEIPEADQDSAQGSSDASNAKSDGEWRAKIAKALEGKQPTKPTKAQMELIPHFDPEKCMDINCPNLHEYGDGEVLPARVVLCDRNECPLKK